MTAVRSSTAVTQTRRPSTSASKSGRISSSSSISTLSSRTSSARLDCSPAGFRYESMLICQIPDREQDQTQPEPRKEIRREDTQQIAHAWSEAPSDLEEDRRPDRGREQYARYENPIRDVQYSRRRGDHDPHPRDVTADDDRPRTPALESSFGAVQLSFSQADVPAVTSDEWSPVLSRDREVARAPQHRSGDYGQVRERVGDRPGGRQVAAICNGRVTRRGQRHPQLLQEDHEEQPARLVMQDEQADDACQRPQPGWFLQPPRKGTR